MALLVSKGCGFGATELQTLALAAPLDLVAPLATACVGKVVGSVGDQCNPCPTSTAC